MKISPMVTKWTDGICDNIVKDERTKYMEKVGACCNGYIRWYWSTRV